MIFSPKANGQATPSAQRRTTFARRDRKCDLPLCAEQAEASCVSQPTTSLGAATKEPQTKLYGFVWPRRFCAILNNAVLHSTKLLGISGPQLQG